MAANEEWARTTTLPSKAGSKSEASVAVGQSIGACFVSCVRASVPQTLGT